MQDLLTLDTALSGAVAHLIYWAGLALIALIGFGVAGAAVGVALRNGVLEGAALGLPLLVGGLLIVVALALIWRGACEFFVSVLSIADDLRAIRASLKPPPI